MERMGLRMRKTARVAGGSVFFLARGGLDHGV